MYKIFILAIFSLLLLACTSTPYIASTASNENGYAQFALTKDVYQITFKANRRTSNDTVVKYLLRRSAEITIENGYHYFSIVRVPEPKGLCPPSSTPTTSTLTSLPAPTIANNSVVKSYLKVLGLEFYEINDHTDFVVIKLLKKYKTGSLDAQTILNNFNEVKNI